jgi:type I restriction enzyme, S subunit
MSFGRYKNSKRSGIEWLGDVPEHWQLKRIKRLIRSIEQGWSPQCEGSPAETADDWGILKVGCVNGGRFRPGENKALPADMEPIPSLGIAKNDVLVSRANTRELVGSTAVADKAYPKLMLCDKLYRLKVLSELCLPSFLSLYLNTRTGRDQLELAATGASSSMLNIQQSTILELVVAVPPVAEQTAIISFISYEAAKIDFLIAEQQRLIKLLSEKRQATISQAVTKGLNPSVAMKESGITWIGAVPEHWKLCPLKWALDTVEYGISESLEPEGNVAILRMGNISGGGKIVMDDLKYVDSIDERLILKKNDLLYNRTNSLDLIGKVGIFEGSREPRVSFASYLVRLRTRVSCVSKFFAYMLNTPGMLGEARGNAIVAIGQCNLNPTRYCALIVAIPPRAEQEDIARHLDETTNELDALIGEAETAVALLEERRTALISAAVTGKIDVRSVLNSESEPEVAA